MATLLRHPTNKSLRHCSQLTSTQVLQRHWLALIQETTTSEAAFATTVREHYEEHYPEHVRTVEFSTKQDVHERMKRDADKISSWFSPSVNARFPEELRESFIAAFPDDRRYSLEVELAARQGMLAVHIPDPSHFPAVEDFGEILDAFNDYFEVVATKMLRDGVLDEKDSKYKAEFMKVSKTFLARIIGFKKHVNQVIKA